MRSSCLCSSASIPSHVTKGTVKSAAPEYSASYAAVFSVTTSNLPVPPALRMTCCSVGTSYGRPKPAYVLPSRSFGDLMSVRDAFTAIAVAPMRSTDNVRI